MSAFYKTKFYKLAVIFPGIGYHTDKPLLYYAKKLARELGYEIIEVPYGNFPKDLKGAKEKLQEVFESALTQAEFMLQKVEFKCYDEILFISKSIGTAVAAAYAKKYGLITKNIFYTPIEITFPYIEQDGIAFHGTDDDWVDTVIVESGCKEKSLPLFITEAADHSLETGDILTDLQNIQVIMKQSKSYMKI